MDWESAKPAKINNLKAKCMKRATWVSKEALKQRKKKFLCIRCDYIGHRSTKCNFLPPEKPETMSLNVAQSTEDEKEEESWELTKLEGVESHK